ncbi:peptide ABC transporter substrate-binding protein [Actinorhabdospora filicis]|uniref:Peptide ABC transporter substrate-binding protein n=1 Tax=Actinorhabdospora filicis TaxID=1785913 RepID=A0A9W6SIA9_9ACTN|nr:ABC transporter substrate-binding protein [Actinorhabdospora filicis]GLZ76482.1 peptide ABC transporter substrate-binding protein [Actinorhabdospora filicis]
MKKRAVWCALAVLPLTAAALAGCGGGSSGGGGDGVISVGIGEPKSLFVTSVGETEGHQVIMALYTPLVRYNDNLETELAAAESVTPSEGNKVWTIKLKDGYTFHNGEKVTSDSYINAWNYGAYGPNAQDLNSYYSKIDGYAAINPTDGSTPATKTLSGLQKVDDLTFKVTLSAPYSGFMTTLGYTNFMPLPSVAFNDPAAFQNSPIGNGPFKMKGNWQHDQLIQVEAWDGYTGTKPKVKGVDFKIYQDAGAQYNDVVGGNLDVVKTIPTQQIANAKKDLGDRYGQTPSGSFQGLAFPVYQKDFENVGVRRAISMAIDRDAIVQTVFANSAVSARSWVSPQFPGARDNTCGEWCNYNPTAAKALYTESGGLPNNSLKISYNADGGHKEWIDATCNQLATNLGITCTGNPVPKFADLLTSLSKKEAVGMFRQGWIPDYPTMDNYLEPLYSCDAAPQPNYSGFCDKTFDEDLAQGFAAADNNAAIPHFQAAESILAEKLPLLPMRFGRNNFGYSDKVKNVTIDLFYELDLLALETK